VQMPPPYREKHHHMTLSTEDELRILYAAGADQRLNDPIDSVRRYLRTKGVKRRDARSVDYRPESHVYFGTLYIASVSRDHSEALIDISKQLDRGVGITILALSLHAARDVCRPGPGSWHTGALQRFGFDVEAHLSNHWEQALLLTADAVFGQEPETFESAYRELALRAWSYESPEVTEPLAISLQSTVEGARFGYARSCWIPEVTDMAGLEQALSDIERRFSRS